MGLLLAIYLGLTSTLWLRLGSILNIWVCGDATRGTTSYYRLWFADFYYCKPSDAELSYSKRLLSSPFRPWFLASSFSSWSVISTSWTSCNFGTCNCSLWNVVGFLATHRSFNDFSFLYFYSFAFLSWLIWILGKMEPLLAPTILLCSSVYSDGATGVCPWRVNSALYSCSSLSIFLGLRVDAVS